MPKAKVQTAVPELPQVKRLTHPESMELVLAQQELRNAKQAEERLKLTLRTQELEAHLALTATRQALETAKADLVQQKQKHDGLSEQLAKKYSFDWSTSGFEPTTGEIYDLPAPNAQ